MNTAPYQIDLMIGKEMYERVLNDKNHPLHPFINKPQQPDNWPPIMSTEQKMKGILKSMKSE